MGVERVFLPLRTRAALIKDSFIFIDEEDEAIRGIEVDPDFRTV
jgi:hypothetical protein